MSGYHGLTSRNAPAKGRRSKSKRVASSNATGMNPVKSSDLTVKSPNLLNVPTKMPRQIANTLFWDTIKVDSTITGSATTIVETNYSFSLNQHPQVAQLTALFDQYCIFLATVKFESALPPGSTASPSKLFTALDFDNSTALGSIAAIEDYSSCEEIILQPWAVHMRSVKPCVKTSAGGTTLALPIRSWVDCAVPAAAHFGIRSIMTSDASTPTVGVSTYLSFAFRNQI